MYSRDECVYIAGTGGPTSRRWYCECDTIEEADKKQQFFKEICAAVDKKFEEITDKQLLNINDMILIPKEKFIAIECARYNTYK
jgi:hypothetical protein